MNVAASSIATLFGTTRDTQRPQIFSGLSRDEINSIAACARSLRKARGEFIYTPGDRADFVYILRSGRVKLSVLSESGKEIAIDIIQPGEIFGEFALVDEALRSNMTQAPEEQLHASPLVATEARAELYPAGWRPATTNGEETFRHHVESRLRARLRTPARTLNERL
jgi:hypothetical protein